MPPDPNLKVIYLTAGAGGMYCGSCLRDNTLARALHELGVDLHLVPLYTPIRTDEPDVSRGQVFFGGINIYLKHRSRFFRAVPRWMVAWLDHPWVLKWVASGRVQTDARRLGDLTLAMLAGTEGPLADDVARLADWLEDERPDIVNLSNLLIAGSIPVLKQRLRVPIVVTLQGDDLFLDQLPASYRSRVLERLRQLASDVDRFIVFSRFYQHKMARLLEIDESRIAIVPLGVSAEDLAEIKRDPCSKRPLTIGFLARAAPEKGLHILVDAWMDLVARPGFETVRLAIAGWNCRPQNPYVAKLQRKLHRAGLADRVQWLGEVSRSEKCRFLAGIDLLCVPMPYEEPKGLFALEALAAGVPVVVPDHGIFPELIADLGGGWLIAEPTASSAAERLAEVAVDRAELYRVGEQGRQRVLSRRSPRVMADATLEVYHSVRGGAP